VPARVAHTGPKATDDIRVQLVNHRGGQRSYLVLDAANGCVHNRADKFLSSFCEETQRTYAYHLVDHLRWLAVNGYREDSITIQDLMRYVALCGAQHFGPLGAPWRQSPLGESAQAVRATCLKGYYLDLTTPEGVNAELRTALSTRRLPNDSDRNRLLLGHLKLSTAANPLSHGAPPNTLACCRTAPVRQCSMPSELLGTG
jgi:hypothetical protein